MSYSPLFIHGVHLYIVSYNGLTVNGISIHANTSLPSLRHLF